MTASIPTPGAAAKAPTGLRALDLVVWIALGLTIVAAAAVAWSVVATRAQTDRSARVREEQLVANGLDQRTAEILKTLETETVWDDAVANLDTRWNESWALANLVQFFTTTNGFRLVYVFDGHDRVRLAHGGRPGADGGTAAAPMSLLIRQVRAKELARGPFPVRPESKTLIAGPLQASQIAAVDGRLYVLAASLVQPDFGKHLPSARAPIVVVGEEIDAAFVAKLSRYYMLRTPGLAPPASSPSPGWARVPLKDPTGRVLGYLTWRPQEPAADVLGRIAAPIALLVALLATSAAAFLLRERRQREVLSQARAAAEAASDSKSAFLANMSHEVRTPLNGILGVTQLLLQAEHTAEQQRLLQIILDSGRGLAAVLNDLLDLSKMDAGHLTIEAADFDLGECLELACQPLRLTAAPKVMLELRLDESARGLWVGDAGRLRQIVSNLASNAVKFTPEGRVQVLAAWRDGALVIEVSDNGPGIAETSLQAIFEDYVQAGRPASRTSGGTGLGLPISRRLAELMGGTIEAESTVGEGSTFRLTLPLPRAERAADHPPAGDEAAAVALAGLRVLAADDNATNRMILRALLEPLGVDLSLVDDGREAVDAYAAGDFDLLLMDVQMPVLDGVSATREIRALESRDGRTRTPILALSANVMVHQLADYTGAGMDGFVSKPIDLHDLLSRMAQAVAQDPATEAAAATTLAG